MTDHNRGAYTPQSDAPLAFDARRTGGPGQRPFPTTLLVSAVILLVLIGVAVFLYRDGMRAAGEAPQPVGEPVGELKAPPPADSPAGSAEGGLRVYTEGESLSAEPKLAPPPEQPLPRPTVPAPIPVAPVAPASAPVAKAPAAPPAPTPAAKAPAATPAPKAAPAPAPVAAAPKAPATPAPAPKTAAPASASAVQIGAFSSPALADDGWSRLARSLPGQMAGRSKRIEEIQSDGRTLYRALVTGFASRAEAIDFCAALQARGESCAVR